MTSDLTHRLPMRWSDLDHLGHVNNVVYLAYATEARALFVERGLVDPALRAVSVTIDFLQPMPLSTTEVVIDQHVDGEVVHQEIGRQREGEHVVHARVQTRLADAPSDLGSAETATRIMGFHARRGDLDVSERLNEVRALEYFQETRVLALAGPGGPAGLGDFVLARTELALGPSVTWRPEPWDFTVGIGSVGTRSFTVEQQWRDGATLLGRARNVMVTFDIATQASRAMTDDERAALHAW